MNIFATTKGFTLLETILYIALFAIVIGGGMIATYNIIQSVDAGNNHVILQEEANFLLRKVNWALTGLGDSSSIIKPTTTDTVLQVTKSDGTQIKICFLSNNFYLQRGVGSCTTSSTLLNSSSIKVSLTSPNTFIFQKLSGIPSGITTSFTLTTIQNGRPASQDFSTTKYLRQ